MRISDHVRSVRHTFASNKARAALTLLGIMIGAGSIVLLAGLLRGGEEALLSTSQRANEADLLSIHNDEPPADELQKTRRELERGDVDTLEATRLLGGVPVAGEASRDVDVERPVRKHVRMIGGTPAFQGLYRLTLEKGRFLTDEDLLKRRRVCVVGHAIWEELLASRPSLDGATLELGGELWQVVGVLAVKHTLGGSDGGFWTWNGRVLVPQTTFDATWQPDHKRTRIYVRLAGSGPLAARMKAVESVVDGTLLRRHLGVHNFKIEGDDGQANQEKLIFTIIKMLLLGTGLLSLFVGGINIMNIMLVTVTERTREIGVRRAIGATPGAILTQFLLEAAFIALTGGIIGVVGGVALSWLTAVLLTHLVGAWNLHIEAWSIALGLGLSIGTGIVFGLFPAWRAARLDPVEALRYE